ncbi:hypothetical protein LY78DRAFT_423102 [Colletotrichum sublineola]|nr:hypothetical protein LY78DRAFT_423102 [Colletotrichum sublineola]
MGPLPKRRAETRIVIRHSVWFDFHFAGCLFFFFFFFFFFAVLPVPAVPVPLRQPPFRNPERWSHCGFPAQEQDGVAKSKMHPSVQARLQPTTSFSKCLYAPCDKGITYGRGQSEVELQLESFGYAVFVRWGILLSFAFFFARPF